MAQELRQSTQVLVVIGPAVAIADGITPVTSLSLSGADEAELLKHNTSTTTDISGATFAALTGVDGYYVLTLTTSLTDTLGMVTVAINDDSLCLPVVGRFMVLSAAEWDRKYDASYSLDRAHGISSKGTLASTSVNGGTLTSGQRADVRVGHWIRPLSGAAAGEDRFIATIDNTTGAFTVSPAFDHDPSTVAYEVLMSPPAATDSALIPTVDAATVLTVLGTPDGASLAADLLTLLTQIGEGAEASEPPGPTTSLHTKLAYAIARLKNKTVFDSSDGSVAIRNEADDADIATRTDTLVGTVHTKGAET